MVENNTRMINIGGIGSCVLSGVLRNLKHPCYPYDNNCTYQSALIDSFLNMKSLFIFDIMYYMKFPVHIKKVLKNNNNTAWDIHYFKKSFYDDVNHVKCMYERRMIRLNETLNSNDNKLLIRMMHTLDNCYPEEVNLHVEKDDIDKWIVFYNTIKEKYSNIKLILISKQFDYAFIKSIQNGVYLINDKDIFDNNNNKLLLFLSQIKYENI
jgi:hypothetical protein